MIWYIIFSLLYSIIRLKFYPLQCCTFTEVVIRHLMLIQDFAYSPLSTAPNCYNHLYKEACMCKILYRTFYNIKVRTQNHQSRKEWFAVETTMCNNRNKISFLSNMKTVIMRSNMSFPSYTQYILHGLSSYDQSMCIMVKIYVSLFTL